MFHKGKHNREKQLRFSIRKVSFGAASVAVAALFMFLGNGAVSATEQGVPSTNGETLAPQPKDQNIQNGTYEGNTVATSPAATVETNTQPSTVENSPSTESAPQKVETLDKKELTEAEKEKEKVIEANDKLSDAEKAAAKDEAKKAIEVATASSEGNKHKNRSRRAAEPSSTTMDTTSDEAANQVYTAPRANAGLDELKEKLEKLPSEIQNNTKINNMNELGDNTNTQSGQVQNIKEFGGWKAVGENGKFAIAKKTDAGVFPIETVNTVYNQNRDGSNRHYKTYTGEQAFDRTANYMLFLSEVRTHASANDGAYDGSAYQGTGLGGATSKAVKNYDGIEKTFKVYSSEVGSKVKVQFKTGYTGDINGTKAKYKVEVITNKNGKQETVYSKIFDPQKDLTDTDAIVTAARDGNGKFIRSEYNDRTLNKTEVESKMTGEYIPTGTAGTFTSKDIDLPKGVTEYTVRISSADNEHLGMGYQSPLRQYALPLSGLDFKITQDTNKIAKDLLTKIYEKLKETVAKDEKGMTADSKAAYDTELEKVKTLVEATDLKTTNNYKTALTAVLQKQKELKVDKTALTAARGELDNLITTVSTDGKVENSITEYNKVKAEAQGAINEAKRVIDSAASTVEEVELAVAKVKQKIAELNAAKAALVDKATEPQKEALAKVDEELKAADTAGKTPESVDAYNKAVGKLQAELEEAKAKAKEVAGKGDNATKAEATEAQAKVAEVKAKLAEAAALLKDKANKDALEKAKAALDTLAKAEDPTAGKTEATKAAYDQAKADAEAAVAEATKVINNENATPEQVAAALVEANAKKAALEAAKVALVDKATEPQKEALAKVDEELKAADTAGKTPESVDAYNKAVEKLQAELEEAKAKAKEVAGKGDNATELEAFRAQAKVAEVKAKLAEAAALLKDKVNKDALEKAKAAVDTALAEKAKAIEANDKLSDAEKAAAKEEAKKAADEAKKAIAEAKDQAGVDAKVAEGKAAVEAVNPVGKEKAKAAVDAALAEKEKAIEANNKLSDAEKQAAKDEAKKAADEAKKAIEAATDQTGVDAKATEGTKAVEAVNPVGKEKAKAAVDAALAEKEKAIEANNKLSDAEKQAAKDEAKKAADEAKKAIEAATDQTGVDAKAAEGTKAVEAVNPVGKEKAKAEVEGELAKKLAELENSTDLTDAEKATTKTRVLDEAKKAIEAIEKATTQEEVEQAIRNFVYHISAVVLEKEEYDLSKLFVNGTVIVKQGEVLTDKDILSKLNLPEGVEVVKVEKPETVVLGKGTAKVTLKLADGTQVTITVPVTVVEGTTAETSTNSSEEETTVNTSDVAKSDATEKSSNNVSKKQLPNTGTTETNTGLAGLGLAMLTGLFAVARRRKNDKN